ncbi:hypothetical protein PHMEG_00040609 [Phytophthora megakarya]|uniref:Uncharacterized protein n=1 Tax=Phytophthora megakarya TaxID=4795 RepID=A0A225UD78_9STRA|nr:hypothetical protein PHMEG_00040609 [Phytophthora megakarya]
MLALSRAIVRLPDGGTCAVPVKQPKNNFKHSTTKPKLADVREQVKADSSVLGNAVGVEVAGELKAKYSNKYVTIIEGKDKLVASDDVRDKFRTKLSTLWLVEKRLLRTDLGTEIESDAQLLCGKSSPMTELIQKIEACLVTSEGFI